MLTDEQIFDILDGCADAELLQKHTHLLAGSVVYHQYFNELAAIHFDLADMPLEKPSANFTENILAALPAEKPVFVLAKKKTWSTKFMYGFFGTILSVLIMAILTAIFYNTPTETTVVQTNQVTELFNSFMNSYFTQIAILVNLIAMLVLFDKKDTQTIF